MNLNPFLLIALCTALLAVLFFITKLRRVRGQLKQSEQAYKRLMTSLSHDVKTPLASLFGYLDALENGLVAGEEKEAYIHVAVEKACHLKHFVEALFEWVKLDTKEQVFHFELCDFNELPLIPIPAFLIICFKMCLCTVAAIN